MSSRLFAIEFRNVSISFEGKRALDDVSFTLESGQMICVTGLSGSGKSVLMRLAAGLLVPEAGQVLIEGREIEGLTESELLAVRGSSMGMVFQEPSLFTGMSVYDNAAYRLNEHGCSEEDIQGAVREILTFVGLELEIDKLPEELSIGMRRRLEFARALVGWPRIMLFDEATAGLDPINARAMLDLVIRATALHRISSLYVTKEMHEIPYLGTHYVERKGEGIRNGNSQTGNELKVLLLDEGKIGFFGYWSEFQSTNLPAVKRMTQPEPGARIATAYIADPWRRRKPLR